MAYYLKKTTLKGRTYLSIDESFYSNEKKGTAHRCYKSLSSIETLKKNGMEDPVAYYQAEVDRMNKEANEEKTLFIEKSPKRYLGYFLLKGMLDRMDIPKNISYFKLATNFNFDLYEVLSSLIYARAVKPCSKQKTYQEVLPYLYKEYNFSYDQLLGGLSYFGNDYEKFVELFTIQTKHCFGIDTDKTYFDCTNFYFEIDREDDFRKKGPSKENRTEPLVGLGLLLDANQIPIGMKLYPGNESEKPVLREVLRELKKQNQIKGKTIQVADKGLNCSANILNARKNGDGYIFSKSVLQLPEIEKKWVLLENDWKEVKDKDGKLLYRYKSCVDEFPYSYVGEDGVTRTVKLTEKRVLTFNPSLAEKKIHEIERLERKARDLAANKAKKDEYGECSKYVSFKSTDKGIITEEKVAAVLNSEAILKDKQFAGYNLLVTSEVNAPSVEIYNVYHNLWRIEESFRIMKSDLDARPVFVSRKATIQGHFLICYLTVLLERLLQFKVFKNKYSANELFDFMREFQVVKGERGYINITAGNDVIRGLAQDTDLPLRNYNLSEPKIEHILKWRP